MPHLAQLLGGVDLVDLAPTGDGGLGILELSGVRRLRNERIGEIAVRQIIRAASAVEIPGLRVRNADLLADLVEAALLRDVVEQVEIDIGRNVSGSSKALLALREHARMAVVTTEHEQGLFRRGGVHFGGDALEHFVKALLLVNVRLKTIVGEAAFGEHFDILRGQHDGTRDAERAMKLAHIAVGKDVAADDDGLQQVFHLVCAGNGRRRGARG